MGDSYDMFRGAIPERDYWQDPDDPDVFGITYWPNWKYRILPDCPEDRRDEIRQLTLHEDPEPFELGFVAMLPDD